MTIQLTTQALSTILNREVHEVHLTVAKGLVLGMELEDLSQAIGIDKAELEELTQEQDFKDLRLLIGAELAKEKIEADLSWDSIERSALSRLSVRVDREQDTDTLLRIAAVANRATRRTVPPKEHVLDPSQAGHRVPLTLTRRYIEKLNGQGGVIERSQEQQISVLDGSAVNPKFEEVKDILGAMPQEARTSQTQLHRKAEAPVEQEMDMASLIELAKRMKKT